MRLIPLSRGKRYAMVSDCDYARLSMYAWQLTSNGYGMRHLPRVPGMPRPTRLMHREVMDAPGGVEIDHINSDKLDNRRENLRFCERGHNQQRAGCRSRHKYRGVKFYRNRWVARIHFNGEEISLGCFSQEATAAYAYNRAATKLYGEHALVNDVRL